jgi:hypothetical protein
MTAPVLDHCAGGCVGSSAEAARRLCDAGHRPPPHACMSICPHPPPPNLLASPTCSRMSLVAFSTSPAARSPSSIRWGGRFGRTGPLVPNKKFIVRAPCGDMMMLCVRYVGSSGKGQEKGYFIRIDRGDRTEARDRRPALSQSTMLGILLLPRVYMKATD